MSKVESFLNQHGYVKFPTAAYLNTNHFQAVNSFGKKIEAVSCDMNNAAQIAVREYIERNGNTFIETDIIRQRNGVWYEFKSYSISVEQLMVNLHQYENELIAAAKACEYDKVVGSMDIYMNPSVLYFLDALADLRQTLHAIGDSEKVKSACLHYLGDYYQILHAFRQMAKKHGIKVYFRPQYNKHSELVTPEIRTDDSTNILVLVEGQFKAIPYTEYSDYVANDGIHADWFKNEQAAYEFCINHIPKQYIQLQNEQR